MIRLYLLVEGQTEETFARDVLTEHLARRDVMMYCRSVQTSRRRGRVFRGGMTTYGKVRSDLIRWTKEHEKPDAFFSTMFDLYALPGDFPGFSRGQRPQSPSEWVQQIEESFQKDIDHPHFVPYIQLHEFEALILSDPSKFGGQFIGEEKAIQDLISLAGRHSSPELIDDGETTSPSKRIIAALPVYAAVKATAGPIIAGAIGLPLIRSKCPHFDAWLRRLEGLPRYNPARAADDAGTRN